VVKAATAAGRCFTKAARRVCRGWHDPRPAHGVHGQSIRTTSARSRCGRLCSAPITKSRTTFVAF
jgi:hypothetical protein